MANQKIKDFYTAEGVRTPKYQQGLYLSDKSSPGSVRRYDLVRNIIRGLNNESKYPSILEIGCANGLYLGVARDFGFKSIVGLEISKDKVDNPINGDSDGIQFIIGDWDNMEFRGFDVILATEVIEHSEDPQRLINSLFEWGNVIIATLPFNENIKKDPLDISKGGIGHLHNFTEESTRELFKDYDITFFKIDDGIIYLIARKKEVVDE